MTQPPTKSVPNSKKLTSNNPEITSRLLRNNNKSLQRKSIDNRDNVDHVDIPNDELVNDIESTCHENENFNSDLDSDTNKESSQRIFL